MHRLLFILLLLGVPAKADVVFLQAPIYARSSNTLMQRVGTVSYKQEEGFSILYCVANEPQPKIIQCVVHTPNDMLMLLDTEVAPNTSS